MSDDADGVIGTAKGNGDDVVAVRTTRSLKVYPGTDVENGALSDIYPGDEVIVTEADIPATLLSDVRAKVEAIRIPKNGEGDN